MYRKIILKKTVKRKWKRNFFVSVSSCSSVVVKKSIKLKKTQMSKWGIWMLVKMTGKGNVFQFLCILKISSQVFRWLMSATFREKAERKLPWLSSLLSERRLLWNWNMPSSSLWDSGIKVFEFFQGLMDGWRWVFCFICFILSRAFSHFCLEAEPATVSSRTLK